MSIYFTTSCEDDGANGIGLEGINESETAGTLRTDTLYVNDIVNAQSFLDSVNTSRSDRWYVGSVGSYDFRSVMRFFFTSEVESVTVRSATLRLVATESFGGSGPLTINLHPIKKSWTADDLRWNRFQEGVDFGDPIASVTVNLPLAAGSIVQMTLPKDTVQHWIWALNDSNRAKLNNGVIMSFSSGATVAQQFYSANILTFGNLPDTTKTAFLDVFYNKFDPVTQILTVDHAYAIPTNISAGASGLNGLLYRDNTPQDPNTITVGGGLPYHAQLKFKTDKVAANGTVNNATLLMNVDPGGNFLYNSTDTISLRVLRVSTSPSDWKPGSVNLSSVDLSRLFNDTKFDRRITDHLGDDTLRVNITNLMHAWTVNPSENFGMQIFSAGEPFGQNSELFRLRFFNSPADRERSPRIILTYTLPPTQ